MRIQDVYALKPYANTEVLLSSLAVSAGEPTEIAAELERIDLNEYLTGGKGDVFLMRVGGDSMEDKIMSGDLLIVNRNLPPAAGDTVIAWINGGYTVKTYFPNRNGLRLVAANQKYPPRQISRKDDFDVFGVVTHVLHKLR